MAGNQSKGRRVAKNSGRDTARAGAKRTPGRAGTKPVRQQELVGHRLAEEKVRASERLLCAINRIQSLFIDEANSDALFDVLLQEVLALTDSAYGFIGGINGTAEQGPHVTIHVITNLVSNEERKALIAQRTPTVELKDVKTLFSEVMRTSRPVIVDDPANDPYEGGLPPGHPPIHAFLGLPIHHGERLIGMLGVANRPGGYNEAVIAYVDPFLSTCGQILEGYQRRGLRAEAETALREANTVVELTMEGISRLDESGRYVFVNQQYAALLGYRPDELVGQSWDITVHPDDRASVLTGFAEMLATGKAEADLRGVKKDGSLIWKHAVIVKPDRSEGKASGHYCFVRDITERKREEALQAAEKQALELVATGIPLNEVLTFICLTIESHTAPMLCSVMLVKEDGAHLSSAAGPSLPEEYKRMVDGMPIDLNVGSCGRAAFLREPAIVADIATDPLWRDHATEVLRYGLKACWSYPICNSVGSLLGTFAAYYRESRVPQPPDLKIVERASSIAALAIEHARMTDALKESEARFRTIADTAPALIWMAGPDRQCTHFNRRWLDYTGRTMEQELGDGWTEGVHPDDVDRCLQIYLEAFGRREAFDMEYRLRKADGQYGWIQDKGVPRFLPDGTFLGYVGACIDVTSRRQAEETLQRTQFAMDQAVDAVYWVDPQANILYTNEAASTMLGYTAEEFLRMTVHDLNPDFPPAVWPGWWKETREKKVVSRETVHCAKDGRRIPIDIRVAFLAYGGQEFHCAFVRDISERKQRDQALRESRERFELAVRATNEGIWDWNILTGEQSWSDRHFALFGLEPNAFTPTYETWISLVHPDDADRVHQVTQHHLDIGSPYDIEARVRMRDGSFRWFHDRGQAVWDSIGRAVRMVGSISDVTERRTAEEALRAAHGELEQRVAERTTQLAMANLSLQEEIVERKRAEKALQLTQFTVDRAAQGIFWVGPNAEILYVNDAACEVLGYPREELRGMTVHDIDPNFPPEAWPAHWEELKRRGSFTFESSQRTKSGGVRYTEVTVNHLVYDGQEYNCAIVRDITERRMIEARLQTTQYAVDHASDQIFLVAPDGHFLDVNEAACRRLEYTKQELLTMSVMDIDQDYPREAWATHWEKFVQAGRLRLETRHRSKSGETYPVEVTANYHVLNGQEIDCAIVRDITERRQAEGDLRASELRYKLLTEATFDGIAIHDQGALLEVNAGLERMFGYEPGELIGRSILDLVADESRDQVVANMQSGVKGPYEAIGRRKDGTTFPGEVVVRPYQYRGKEVRLVAGRDITERKHLEAERLRYMEELERQVAQRSAEVANLEAQRAQTEQLAAMGRLAAGVAHEINNPIAGIKNAFRLVKQAIDPAHPHYEFAGMIDREIARVSSIVQNMYQLYRPESGKAEPVDLQTMMKDMEALFAKRLQQRRLRLVIDVDPCVQRLRVPRGDLLQVLLNLLNNAIDCSSEGSRIRVILRAEPEMIRIGVCDEGSGVPPDVLPHIFDPFYTTKTGTDQKGLGLGLSVSRSLVMAMGGRIEVETQSNRGSTFSILIPRNKVVMSVHEPEKIQKEVVIHED